MPSSTPPPPYVGFGVFQSTVETLSQSTVPSGPLDRRVLDQLSGADYGALISALRFLGLVDDQRKATQPYRDLVASWKKGSEHYKDALIKVIGDRYDSIIGTVDMETGTAAEVEKAFKDAGVPHGQMLTKTIRFYIKALSEMGVPVSHHITKPKRQTPSTTRKNGGDKTRPKSKSVKPEQVDEPIRPDVNSGPTAPAGFERLPIPGLAGAFIQYPSDLAEPHCALFEAMIGVLRTYVKGRVVRKEKG